MAEFEPIPQETEALASTVVDDIFRMGRP